MINPAAVCLFLPNGLTKFKRRLFWRIGDKIIAAGGRVCKGDYRELAELPDDIIPIVGASPELLPLVRGWRERGRTWIGWDRGYARRIFATWLPRGDNGGFYRWTINAYQMKTIRDVPSDRWDALKTPVQPWRKNGNHIVVALPSTTYSRSHDGADVWTHKTLRRLKSLTSRQIVLRDKESKRPLQDDLRDAHCLVSHGSIAAVEAVICGCPVIVHPDSAAALIGLTDLSQVESPIYPERGPWLWSLAYSQYNETELVDGTLWRLIE